MKNYLIDKMRKGDDQANISPDAEGFQRLHIQTCVIPCGAE